MSLHKTHVRVVESLVKIATVSWRSLRRFVKPAPGDLRPPTHSQTLGVSGFAELSSRNVFAKNDTTQPNAVSGWHPAGNGISATHTHTQGDKLIIIIIIQCSAQVFKRAGCQFLKTAFSVRCSTLEQSLVPFSSTL